MDAHLIERIKDATNLVDLISGRVRLKKTGKDYTGLCPFHDEKSPSFTVSPAKQFYHCFGCGANGDAIKWLTETEGLQFEDAARKLAHMAGIAVPEKSNKGPSHDPLYAANAAASSFYCQNLRQAIGTDALRYLVNRGITNETMEAFQLGAAGNQLPATDQVSQLQAGLLTRREDGSIRPFFYQRLTFPIRDRRGRVIAFGGRTLQTGAKPKYINTSQTSIFDKSNVLYGLYEAQQHIRKASHALVVEGYMDVIMLHQHGLHNAVAGCGTSVTPQHIQTLFAMANRVTFAFDADKAGKLAARRVIDTLLPLVTDEHMADFAFVPNGHDPDSYVRVHGAEAMRSRIAQSKPLSSVIEAWFTPGPTATLETRAQLSIQAAILLGKMQAAPNLRSLLAQRVSELLGLTIKPKMEKGVKASPPTESEQRSAAPDTPRFSGTAKPSALMQTQVINPVVRTLLAHPETIESLPQELAAVPVIAAAVKAIDTSGDIERSMEHCRGDMTVLQTLQAVARSAAGRRELKSLPDMIRTDANHVFNAAIDKLRRIAAVENSPSTTGAQT